MRIIIVGAGKVGYALAEKLTKENHEIIVIDTKSDRTNHALNTLDVSVMEGNGASYEILVEAGTASADLLIAVTGSDEVNILCCLTAKKVGAEHVIARISKPEYSRQVELMRDELGLSAIMNPDQGTAEEISRILRLPSVMNVNSFFNGKLELVEFKVIKDSIMDTIALFEFRNKIEWSVLVCAVERDGQIIIPKGDFILKAGDRVSVAGKPSDLYHLFQHVGVIKKKMRNVMIIGGSRIATYLARTLLSSGMQVRVIEKNLARCKEIAAAVPNVDLINGDGTQPDILLEEGITDMDAFIALTDSDEENIIVSMYAQSLGIKKIITKVNEQHIIDMLENSSLETFIQPKKICSEQILHYVRAMNNAEGSSMKTLHSLANGRIEALGFKVLPTSKCTGKFLKDLPIRMEALIAFIGRGKEFFIPGGNDCIEPGDRIVVITSYHGIMRLDDILES